MYSLSDIQEINLKTASYEERAAINRHNNRLRKERLPDDPPIPLEEFLQTCQNIPDFVNVIDWCVWNPDRTEIIGEGELVQVHMDHNRHISNFDVTVDREYRCRGLGSLLLGEVARAAKEDGRQALLTETYDRIPAGESFLSRVGGKRGLETHTNQLKIDDLDRSLIESWLARGRENTRFELGLWDGPYPEEYIDAILNLYELANDQPLGDLDIEDQHITAEQLRQMEKLNISRGNQRWTYYVLEKSTGKFAGYTETIWNPNRPEILRQDMTGVFPEYRSQGLGRWLKAAMLDKVLRDRPQVKYVRTGNADSNAAMLKINTELGFEPYMASILWQIEIDDIFRYLEGRGTVEREEQG